MEPLEFRRLQIGGAVLNYGLDGIAFPSPNSGSSATQVISAASGGEVYQLHNDTLTRLLPDGAVDPSFGGGSLNVDAGEPYFAATDIAATPDGGVIVELHADSPGDAPTGGSLDYGLIKFNQDGSRDMAFGKGGVVDTSAYNVNPLPTTGVDTIYSGPLTVQDNGSILWSFSGSLFSEGEPGPLNYQTVAAVVRMSPEGQIDSNFLANQSADVLHSVPFAILDGPAGSLLLPGTTPSISNVEGSNNPDVVVQSENADGTANGKYGSGSYSQLGQFLAENHLLGAVVDSKGRVTVDGIINGAAMMLRFTASGKLDHAFGTKGKVVLHDLSFNGLEANNLIREPDGSLLVSGEATPKDSHGSRPAVQHYSTKGVFDPSYGGSGLGILASKVGLLVGDASALASGPKGTFLVATALGSDAPGGSGRDEVIDDIAAS